jgi:hypothetical protein
MREQVFQSVGLVPIAPSTGGAASATSSITSAGDKPPGNDKKPIVLVAQVLNLQHTNRELLPVPIQSNLPHIHLKVGPPDDEHDPIELSCLVDSSVSLNNGNFYFFTNIAKNLPHLIVKVYTSETYAPLCLSGIVQNDGSAVTTELPVAFELSLPYLLRDGSPTTLIVATGPHTGVNMILGMPFCEASGMVLDFVDNVADCKHLTCPPFPLVKKRAGVTAPSSDAVSVDFSAIPNKYDVFIKELQDLERNISSVYNCVSPDRSRHKSVKFDNSAAANLAVSSSQHSGAVEQSGGADSKLSSVPILSPGVYRAYEDVHHDDESRGSHSDSA